MPKVIQPNGSIKYFIGAARFDPSYGWLTIDQAINMGGGYFTDRGFGQNLNTTVNDPGIVTIPKPFGWTPWPLVPEGSILVGRPTFLGLNNNPFTANQLLFQDTWPVIATPDSIIAGPVSIPNNIADPFSIDNSTQLAILNSLFEGWQTQVQNAILNNAQSDLTELLNILGINEEAIEIQNFLTITRPKNPFIIQLTGDITTIDISPISPKFNPNLQHDPRVFQITGNSVLNYLENDPHLQEFTHILIRNAEVIANEIKYSINTYGFITEEAEKAIAAVIRLLYREYGWTFTYKYLKLFVDNTFIETNFGLFRYKLYDKIAEALLRMGVTDPGRLVRNPKLRQIFSVYMKLVPSDPDLLRVLIRNEQALQEAHAIIKDTLKQVKKIFLSREVEALRRFIPQFAQIHIPPAPNRAVGAAKAVANALGYVKDVIQPIGERSLPRAAAVKPIKIPDRVKNWQRPIPKLPGAGKSGFSYFAAVKSLGKSLAKGAIIGIAMDYGASKIIDAVNAPLAKDIKDYAREAIKKWYIDPTLYGPIRSVNYKPKDRLDESNNRPLLGPVINPINAKLVSGSQIIFGGHIQSIERTDPRRLAGSPAFIHYEDYLRWKKDNDRLAAAILQLKNDLKTILDNINCSNAINYLLNPNFQDYLSAINPNTGTFFIYDILFKLKDCDCLTQYALMGPWIANAIAWTINQDPQNAEANIINLFQQFPIIAMYMNFNPDLWDTIDGLTWNNIYGSVIDDLESTAGILGGIANPCYLEVGNAARQANQIKMNLTNPTPGGGIPPDGLPSFVTLLTFVPIDFYGTPPCNYLNARTFSLIRINANTWTLDTGVGFIINLVGSSGNTIWDVTAIGTISFHLQLASSTPIGTYNVISWGCLPVPTDIWNNVGYPQIQSS